MSTLNEDRKVLQGRKNPLKGAEASKRDQIPTNLAETLDELEVGPKVVEIWNHGNANRADWLQRQEEFLADWDEHLVGSAEGPFEGASNLHLPIPLIVAKTMHARFLQALLGIDPYFTTKARTEAFLDRSAMVQDLMAYTLKDWINCYDGVDEAVDLWLWDWITAGVGISKARWETQFERFLDVKNVTEMDFRQEVDPETGEEVIIPFQTTTEKEVPVTRLKFQGPMLEHRQPEDVLIVGGKGDPQKADAVIDCYDVTASELWTYADQKVFDSEVVEEIIDGGPDAAAAGDVSNIKQMRAVNAGTSSIDVNSDLDRYKILEAYLRMDVDESGINTDIVVWVHLKSKKILRATYLYRVNKSGERPFFKIDFYKRAGQDYGTGLIEILHPLSKEMDAIHNMRIDFGLLATMPIGFYKPTSSIEPETLSLRPGDLIPVDNPREDVYFPNMGNRTAFGFQEEAAIQTLVERLTGINDMSLGVMSGAQGATRTATGARALLGESNANLDVHLRRLHRGWRRTLKYLLHMLQQRLPTGFEFRVIGDNGEDYFTQIKNRDDIAGDYDFEISPNTSNSNKAIQEETATSVLQAIQNPIFLQMGVVTSGNLYEALKSWMKAKGIKDFGKYIQKPADYMYVMTPGEEVNRILRGMTVPVLPQMDHEGFLEYFELIEGEDELLGQFSEDAARALKAQAVQHMQMLQAMQAQQAQVANAAQMRTNADMSAQQAPVAAAPAAPGPMSESA